MKKTVALIYGGEGYEREISIKSAENLSPMIDRQLYELLSVEIEKDGSWYIIYKDRKSAAFPVKMGNSSGLFSEGKIIPVDCAIPCLHGDFGEDGVIQGALTAAHISYIGQDVYASGATSDKIYTKAIAEALMIPTAKYILLSGEDFHAAESLANKALGYPMFLKPARLGSSYGAHPVYNKKEFEKAYSDAISYAERIIAEELISFDYEVECALFEDENIRLLPNGRILSSGTFYDYSEKYIQNNRTLTEISQDYDAEIQQKIYDYSSKLTKAIGLRHLARIDYFVTESKEIIFNEINVFPGMTKSSLYPRITEMLGLQSGEFINKLIYARCGA